MQLSHYLNQLSRNQKKFLMLFHDFIALILSILITLYFVYGDFVFISSYSNYVSFSNYFLIFLNLILFIPIFYFFGLYQNILSLSGLKIIFNISLAVLVYGLILNLLYFLSPLTYINYHQSILQPSIFFIFVLNGRLFAIMFIQNYKIKYKENILIVGINEDTLNYYFTNSRNSIKFIIDFDSSKIGQKINGIKISSFDEITNIVSSNKINKIVLSIENLSFQEKKDIYQTLDNFEIPIDILDFKENLLLENNKLDPLLFSNRNINWDKKKIEELIKNKIVLVTGAGGSIGSQISLQLLENDAKKLIFIDNSELNLYNLTKLVETKRKKLDQNFISFSLVNIKDKDKLENIFSKFKPDLVFHAAAYKHVNLLEFNELEALGVNIFGTLNLLELCIKYKTNHLTLISTDKAVNPTNIMGKTKRFCEIMLQSYYKEFANNNIKMSIIRFGNVINSNGSVLPLFKKQILYGGPVTVTHPEVSRYFMTINEAVGLVLQTCVISKGGEVFVLNMGESIKILDIAKKMIKFSGYNYHLENEETLDKKRNSIPIKFVGLRKGEKLNEEIFYGNRQEKTNHDSIMQNIEKVRQFSEVNSYINELKQYYKDNDIDLIRDFFKKNIAE